MSNPIDRAHFQELSRQDPADVCRRTACRYDAAKNFYTITVWDDDYAIYPHDFRIERVSNHFQNPHPYLYLFIIHYLLQWHAIDPTGEWISEKDIPGGATFFRGPHAIPTQRIAERYGNDLEEFSSRCEQLHGVQLDLADRSYRFAITAHIDVAVLYWRGDEEFPPEAKILYDKVITKQLAADVIFALAVEICARLSGRHT